jgi:hypothetical protein
MKGLSLVLLAKPEVARPEMRRMAVHCARHFMNEIKQTKNVSRVTDLIGKQMIMCDLWLIVFFYGASKSAREWMHTEDPLLPAAILPILWRLADRTLEGHLPSGALFEKRRNLAILRSSYFFLFLVALVRAIT